MRRRCVFLQQCVSNVLGYVFQLALFVTFKRSFTPRLLNAASVCEKNHDSVCNLLVELEHLQEADSEAKQIQPDSQASELNKQLRKDIVYY